MKNDPMRWLNRGRRKGRSDGRSAEQRERARRIRLSVERFEDRTLMTGQVAQSGAGQVFNLSGASGSTAPLYIREDPSQPVLEYSDNQTTWHDFLNLTSGSGTLVVDAAAIAAVDGPYKNAPDDVPGAWKISGAIYTQGRSLRIKAQGSIEVGDNVVISTNQTGGSRIATAPVAGDSGSLSLEVQNPLSVVVSATAPNVRVGKNALLLASVTYPSNFGVIVPGSPAPVTNFRSGDVTISSVAQGLSLNIPILQNLGYGVSTSNVTLAESAGVYGQNVTITARSSDQVDLNTVPFFQSPQGSALGGLVQSALDFASSYLSLPFSITFKAPQAGVSLDRGAQVGAEGTATITSQADADAVSQAVFATDLVTRLGLAIGIGMSRPTATTTVTTDAVVAARGRVNLGSTANSRANITASVSQNLGPGFLPTKSLFPYSTRIAFLAKDKRTQTSPPFQTDPDRVALGISASIAQPTSRTEVQKSASILSSTHVDIQALGTIRNSAYTQTASYWDGRAAIGVSIGYSNATVEAIVNGKITVAGTAGPEQTQTFNPFTAVDFATSTIKFPTATGYQTGDRLEYSSTNGNAIPGLVSDRPYYAIKVDATSIRLAETAADAMAGNFIAFGGVPTLTLGALRVPITKVNDSTNTIEFAYDTGLKSGDLVTYGANPGQGIGGLTSGTQYKVVTGVNPDNAFAIRLTPAAGFTPVSLNVSPSVTLGGTRLDFNVGTRANTISFDLYGQPFSPKVDAQADTIDLGYAHRFADGDRVVYSSGGAGAIPTKSGNTVSALVPGAVYKVQLVAGSATRIRLTTASGVAIDLGDASNAAMGSAQRFVPEAATMIANGDAVVFRSPLGLSLDGLVDGTTYYAIKNDKDPGVYALARTKAEADTAYAAGQQTYDDAKQAFEDGIVEAAKFDYDNGNLLPDVESLYADSDAYASYVLATFGESIDQLYLSQNPGQEALYTATGIASARTTPTSRPIVVPFSVSSTTISGTRHTLTPAKTGISVNAQLVSYDASAVYSGIGSEPTITSALSNGALAPSLPGIVKGLTGQSSFTQTNIAKNLPKTASGDKVVPDSPDWSFGGSLAILVNKNVVDVKIGGDAVLKTDGDITLTSNIRDTVSTYADANLSKPQDSTTSKSLAIALSLGVYNNTAITQIDDGAQLDATGRMQATANVTYPFLFPTNASSAMNLVGKDLPKNLLNFLGGTLGLDSFVFNSWTRTGVAGNDGSIGLAGSFAINFYTNTAATMVGDALINQDAAYRRSDVAQTVVVDAQNSLSSLNQTGVFALDLSPDAVARIRRAGQGGLAGVGVAGNDSAFGGSVYVMAVSNTTFSQVGDGARIYTSMPLARRVTFSPSIDTATNTIDLGTPHGFTNGQAIFYDNPNAGAAELGGLQSGRIYYAIVDPSKPNKLRLAASPADASYFVPAAIPLTSAVAGSSYWFTPASLSVTASTNNLEISLAASGGAADSYGVAGAFGLLLFENRTTAQVVSGAQVTGPTMGGNLHGLNIDANDATSVINLAGGVITGSKQGFGASFTGNVVSRMTRAILGANPDAYSKPGVNGPTTVTDAPGTSSMILGGNLAINARNSGNLVSFTIAAAVANSNNEFGKPAGSPSSSSFSPILDGVVRLASGEVADAAAAAQKVQNGAQNVYPSAAREDGIGVAGSISLNIVPVDTAAAFINEKRLTANDPANIVVQKATVTASNQTVVAAIAGGIGLSASEAADNTTGVGGAIAYSQLSGNTTAYIAGGSIRSGGPVTVLATRGGYIGVLTAGVGAAVGGADESTGVGGSISVNLINDSQSAYLLGTFVTLAGDLRTEAKSSSLIVTVGGALGFGGTTGVGVAIAVNIITSTTTASLRDSTISQIGGGLSVKASNENPSSNARIVALTGSAGIASGGTADSSTGGAGMLSVNVITSTTDAYLQNTTYTNTNANAATNGVSVVATDKSWIISVGLAAGGAGAGDGVGAALSINVIANAVKAHLDSSNLTTSGALVVRANSEETIGTATAGIGAAGTGNGIAGSGSVNVISNTTSAYVTGTDSAPSSLTVGGSIEVSAKDQSLIVGLAGGVGISLESSGVGAAIGVNVITNTTEAYIEKASVRTTGAGSSLSVLATEASTIVTVVAGVGGGTGSSGAGSIAIDVIRNTTQASIRNAQSSTPGSSAIDVNGNVAVAASDSSTIVSIAGAVAVSFSESALGGSLSVNSVSNTTEALIQNASVRSRSGSVVVTSGYTAPPPLPSGFSLGDSGEGGSFSVSLPAIPEALKGAIVSVSLSGSLANQAAVAGALPINVITNTTNAAVTGSTITTNGGLQVQASDESVIGSGTLAAGVGQNAAGATLGSNTIANRVTARVSNSVVNSGGSVGVVATENASIYSIAVGGAVAGNFALGGALSVNAQSNQVEAVISGGSTVVAPSVTVQAIDTVKVYSGVGGLAFSAGTTIGGAVVNNDIADTVKAHIDDSTVTATTGDVVVKASLSPSVGAATLGGAGSLGNAFAGSLALFVLKNTTQAYISGATTRVSAEGNVVVSAFEDLDLGAGAGGIAVGSTAVGLANSTVIAVNETNAWIGGGSSVDARGNGTPYQAYTGAKDGKGLPITEAIRGISVTAVAFQDLFNLAVGGAAGANAGGGSLTVQVIVETTRARIDTGAQINQTVTSPNPGQTVNVRAASVTRTVSGAGGFAAGSNVGVGVGIDVGVVSKKTEAYIADASSSAQTFGSGAVDTTKNSINLGYQHNYTTGQALVYNPGSGTAIGILNEAGNASSLVSGNVYYAIIVDAKTIKLARTRDQATYGQAIDLTSGGTGTNQGLTPAPLGQSTSTFGPSGILSSDRTNSIGTSTDHGFTDGQLVLYSSNGGTDVGGLKDGQLYYAIVDGSQPGRVKLAASATASQNDTAIPLTSQGSAATQSLTGVSLGTPSVVAPASVVVNSRGNVIATIGSGLTTGQAVVYDSGGGPEVGGLTNGTIYYVISGSSLISTPDIRLAATPADALAGNAITLSASSSTATQSLKVTSLGTTTATFGPDVVSYYAGINDPAANAIDLGANNPFTATGQAVVYNSGGGDTIAGLTDGQVYYVIRVTGQPNLVKLALTASDASNGIAVTLRSPGSSASQSLRAVTVSSSAATFKARDVTPGTLSSGINFGGGNPFTTSQPLLYRANGGAAIGGLVDGQVYYAFVDPDTAIPDPNVLVLSNQVVPKLPPYLKLAASQADAQAGRFILLTSSGNAAQSFTPLTISPEVTFNSSEVVTPAAVNSIKLTTPAPFTTGQTIIYDNGGSPGATGLVNGQVYYAIVDANDPTRFRVATSAANAAAGIAVALTGTGTSTGQKFTAVSLPAAGSPTNTATRVKAQGDVLVRADSQESVISFAVGGAGSLNLAIGGAVGTYVVTPTTRAYVGPQANVLAQGNVQVAANDVNNLNMLAGAVAGSGGVALGGSVGVSVVVKTTEAFIAPGATVDALAKGGTISPNSGSFTEQYAPSSFNPSTAMTVDSSNDTITLGFNHGFVTGQAVVYDAGDGRTIGGLTSGRVYYVIVDPTRPTKLRLAATSADALAVTPVIVPITSTGGGGNQSFRTLDASDAVSFNAGTSVLGTGRVGTIDLGVSNPFTTTGARVVYNAGGGNAIGGLVDGATYYVIANPSKTSEIRLAATSADAIAGKAIALASYGTTTSQGLSGLDTAASVTFGPSAVTPSGQADEALELGAATNLSTGQAVVYNPGTGTAISGLVGGRVYFAIVDAGKPKRLQLAATSEDAFAGNALTLTGGTGTQTFTPVNAATATFNPASTFSATENVIDLGYNHGYTTGQAVNYKNVAASTNNPAAIGGLSSGSTYYAIVDPNFPTKLRLAATRDDAEAGNAILLSAPASGGTTYSITPYGFELPYLDSSNGATSTPVTTPGLFSRRLVTPDTKLMRGVAVTATSSDNIEQFVIAGGGAGTVAVNLSGGVHVTNNTTNAYICSGTLINTQAGASSNQDVLVASGAAYYHLGVGGAASGAGGVAVGAGVDVAVVTLNTSAHIDDGATVNAANDVSVVARNLERLISVVVGFAGAGTGAVSGSVAVPVVNNTTLAYIGNVNPNAIQSATRVVAGNNVLIAANDDTDVVTVAGAAGLGILGAGLGISVPVVSVTKNTQAYISNNAEVSGQARGTTVLSVLDGSVPTLPVLFDPTRTGGVNTTTNAIDLGYSHGFQTGQAVLYDNGGGISIGGLISGTTYYAIVAPVSSKTLKLAATRQDALSGRAVDLTSVGTGKLHSIRMARDFATKSIQGIAVQANSSQDVLTVAVAAGGGSFIGLAGAVAVVNVNATTKAFVNDAIVNKNDSTVPTAGAGQSVSVDSGDFTRLFTVSPSLSVAGLGLALAGAISVGSVNNLTQAYIGSGATVNAADSVDVKALADKDLRSTTVSLGGAAGAGVTASVSVFNIGAALDSQAKDALREKDNSSNNVSSTLSGLTQVGAVSTNLTSTADDQSGSSAGSIAAGASLNNIAESTRTANGQAGSTANALYSTTAPASGVSAFIGGTGGAGRTVVRAGGDINVEAEEAILGQFQVGGVSVGIGAIGVAISIANVHSNTQAFVNTDASLEAGGEVSVSAGFDDSIDTNIYAGAGGVAALGAQVALVTDDSNQLAYINDGARVISADSLSVTADADRLLNVGVNGISVAGVVEKGSDGQIEAGGSTLAFVGSGSQIGQQAGKSVGSLTISASNTTSATSGGLIVNAGVAAIGVNRLATLVDPDVKAFIGSGARVSLTGAAALTASSTTSSTVNNRGGSGGALSIAAPLAQADIDGDTWAYIDQGTTLNATGLSISAVTPRRNANATSFVVNQAFLGGTGTKTTASVGGSVLAFAGPSQVFTFNPTTSVDATSRAITTSNSNAIRTGDRVVYDNGGGANLTYTDAGGVPRSLTSGATYFAIVNPADPVRIKLALTAADATAGNFLRLNPLASSTSGSPIQSLTRVTGAPTALNVAPASGVPDSGKVSISAGSASSAIVGVTIGSGAVLSANQANSDATSNTTTSAFVGRDTTIGTTSTPVSDLSVTATSDDVATNQVLIGTGSVFGSGSGSDTQIHVTPTTSAYLAQNVTANVDQDMDVLATVNHAEGHATANTYGGAVGGTTGVPNATVTITPKILTSIGTGSTLTIGGDLTVKSRLLSDAPASSNLTDFVQGVDTTRDAILFTGHNLPRGSLVTYIPQTATTAITTPNPSGYLQQYLLKSDGTPQTDSSGAKILRTYHVLPILQADGSADPDRIRLGETFQGTAINAGDLFASGSGVDAAQNVIRFDGPHGFVSGDAVRYAPASGNSVVGGLLKADTTNSGTIYYVRKIDDTTIKLYSSRADAVAMAVTFTAAAIDSTKETIKISGMTNNTVVSYRAPSPFAITPDGVNKQVTVDSNGNVTSVTSDPANAPSNTILVGTNDFATGDAVVYRTSDPSNPIGGLVNSRIYYVITNPSKPFQIQLAATRAEAFPQTSGNTTTPPKPIALNPGLSSASATQFLVRPGISGLVSGQSYKLVQTSDTTDAADVYQFRRLSDNSIVEIDAAGLAGTQSLYKDGVALGSTTSTVDQYLYLVISGAATPARSDQLLSATGQSLRTIFTPPGATGQTTVSTDNGSGALFGGFATATSTLTNTPTIKSSVAAGLVTVGGNLEIATDSTVNSSVTANAAGGAAITSQKASATSNYGSSTAAAVNKVFLGVEDDKGNVTASGVRIVAGGDVNLRAVTSITTNPKATSSGGGAGAGLEAYATSNLYNATSAVVGTGAELTGQTVAITADTDKLAPKVESSAKGGGIVGASIATSTSNLDSANVVRLGGTGTRITGLSGVIIDAKASQASLSVSADGFFIGIGPTLLNRPTSYAMRSRVEAEAGGTVSAGPSPTSPVALKVTSAIVGGGYNVREQVINWDANIVVASAQSPYLEIDSDGNIVKAIGITVDDSATAGASNALKAGKIQSSTVVVNTVPNSGSEVVFDAGTGVIKNSADNPYPTFTFTDTFQQVTILNNSDKVLSIGDIDVATRGTSGSQPTVRLNASNVVTSTTDFEFDVRHAVVPTAILIEQNPSSTKNILLTGTIENPIGTTTIRNRNGGIVARSDAAGTLPLIRTNILDLQASTSIVPGGTSTHDLNVELVQSTDPTTSTVRTPRISAVATTGDIDLNIRGRNRATGNQSLTIQGELSAGGAINVNLGNGVADAGSASSVGSIQVTNSQINNWTYAKAYSYHFYDDTKSVTSSLLDRGVYADLTTGTAVATTFDFRDRNAAGSLTGLAGLSSPGSINLVATATPTAPLVTIAGVTKQTGATGTINVTANGPITLTQESGSGGMRVGTVSSRASNVSLSVPGATTAVDDFLLISGGSITAPLGSISIAAGGDVTISANSTVQALTSVTIAGQNGGSAAVGTNGSTINVFSAIQAPTVTLNGGTNADTFNIRATDASSPVTIQTLGGGDTINVGSLAPASGGILTGIKGSLAVTGTGLDTLNVDDTGSTSDRSGTLTATRINGFGMGSAGLTYNGLAALNLRLGSGNDTLTISDTSTAATDVNAGDGGDTVNVRSTTGTLDVTLGEGLDTVNVGSIAPSSGSVLFNIQGGLNVVGSGDDTLNADDSADSLDRTGTLTSTQLSGFGMGSGGITYSGLSALNLRQGTGNDTLNILSTSSAATRVDTGSGRDTTNIRSTTGTLDVTLGVVGADTVNVGSLAPATGGVLDGIQGALSLVGGGSDRLNVDDTGTTVDRAGTLTSTQLTGFGMGTGGITYGGLLAFNLRQGSGNDTLNILSTSIAATDIDTGAGGDIVNIRSTTGTLRVATGAGTDTVDVGSLAPATGGILGAIQGALNVVGSGDDTLNADNTGDTADRSGTLTSTQLTGFGMGGGITYSGLSNLNIRLGAGADNLTVASTSTAATDIDTAAGNDLVHIRSTTGTLRVTTGTGTDMVNVGSLAPATGGALSGIQGALSVVGSGDDTLNIDETGDPLARTGTLTQSSLTGFGMGPQGIGYSGISTLDLNLGSGGATGNALTINVTTGTDLPATTRITAGSGGLDQLTGTWGGDLNGTLNLRRFRTSRFQVGGNVNGTVTSLNPGTVSEFNIGGSIASGALIQVSSDADPVAPTSTTGLLGNLGTLTVGGSIAGRVTVSGNLGTLVVGTPNTPTTGGINDVTGSVLVGGQLTTGSVSGDVSGTISETLTINSLYIGGSLTQTGLISAVNTVTPGLGNINTLTIGKDLAGTIKVSGTLGTFNLGGSLTVSALLDVANLNSMSIGGDLAGRLNVSNTLRTLTVGGGTPGTINAGQIGTVAVAGSYGPLVARIREAGIQRRIEAATPDNPFPTPLDPPAPTPAISPAGVTFRYFYEGLFSPTVAAGRATANLADPQLTVRVANTASTAPDQFDLSLVTYNSTAKFNLARLDAVGASAITGIRNVAVEGNILSRVTAAANAFNGPIINAAGVAVTNPAGVYLPNDQVASVAVRDYVPARTIAARSIQGIGAGSLNRSNGTLITGSVASATDMYTLLATGTPIVQAGSTNGQAVQTFRVPFGDQASQQVGFLMDLTAGGTAFNNSGFVFVVQSVLTPNANGTANVATQSNAARGAVIAMIDVTQNFNANGTVQASTVRSVAFRGDGGSIRTSLPIAEAITSTGPLGDLILQSPLTANITAPNIFGSILPQGAITGTIQTTGLRTDPITSAVTPVHADLGRVFVTTVNKAQVLTSTQIAGFGAPGARIISRGNLISQVGSNGDLAGVIAVQGDLGATFTYANGRTVLVNSGSQTSLKVATGGISGQVIVMGNVFGDIQVSGGMKAGRVAVRKSILSNVTIKGKVDEQSAFVVGGSIGSVDYGTSLDMGNVAGIFAATGSVRTTGAASTGALYYKTNSFLDAQVIDAIFTQGVAPISTIPGYTSPFDQTTPTDLANLSQMLINLKRLTVRDGRLVIADA